MTGALAMWLMMCIPLFFWGGCPCCKEGDCTSCPGGSPYIWEMTAAGIADNTCTLCNNWNGTFELFNDPLNDPFERGCFWRSNYFSAQYSLIGPCNTYTTAHWQLNHSDTGWILRARLDLAGTNVRQTYTMSGTFDCQGPNTFTSPGIADADCTGWPASITLTPG